MSTPPPRPALRKAGDAHIHPAVAAPVPMPSQAPRTSPVRAASRPAGSRAAVPPIVVNAPAGRDPNSADGALRPTGDGASPKTGKGRAPTGFHGSTSDAVRGGRGGLLGGKEVPLDVEVPKNLRKAARSQAERAGTSLDVVVTHLLAGWVDGS